MPPRIRRDTVLALSLGGWVSAAALAGAVLLAPGRLATGAADRRGTTRRLALATVSLKPNSESVAGWRTVRSARSRAMAAFAIAGAAVALLVGGGWGACGGLSLALGGPAVVARLESGEQRTRRRQLARDLPAAVDLLGACLVAGASPPGALTAVAGALAGPVAEVFAAVAAALALGADAELAWQPWLRHRSLAQVARAMIRAEVSGAPLATDLLRTASELRAARRVAADAAARRVGVLAVAPLGLCFLPAFVLLGIVPVVWGLAAAAFGAGQ